MDSLKKELEMKLIKMFNPKILYFLDEDTPLPFDRGHFGELFCKFGTNRDVVLCVKDGKLYTLSIRELL